MRALAAGLLLAACSAGVAGPRWAGPPLDTVPRMVTAYDLTPLPTDGAARTAARLLGAGARIEVGADRIAADRPPAAGPVPGAAAVLAAGRRVLTAFGLVPEQWAATAGPAGTVTFAVTDDVWVLAPEGVALPAAEVRVDARGVRSFALTPVRVSAYAVRAVSAREAFGRVGRPGRYVSARPVLVAGGAALRPHWEFATDAGELVRVPAVLTP